MPKRKPPTEQAIQDRLRCGEGSGDKEWIRFRDFSSQGNTSRFFSPMTGRLHLALSGIEDDLFLTVEQQRRTHDIHLQRAMEREITTACADALGFRHPTYPGGVVAVMSLDAVVHRKGQDGADETVVFDSKPSADLCDRRTLEKLSIHRLYCQYHGWRHYLVTEKTFSPRVRSNLAWVRKGRRKTLELEVPAGLFTDLPLTMMDELLLLRRHLRLDEFCASFDRRHNHLPGTGMRVMQHLAWSHQVNVDAFGIAIETSSTKGLLQPSAKVR